MAKLALHVLAAGMVLDRSVLIDLGQDEFASTIETIREAPNAKMLTVVHSADDFFNPKTLVKMLDQDDDRCLLVNEKIQFFTNDQMNALRGKKAIQGEVAGDLVVEMGAGQKAAPVVQDYKYVPVPEGWSIVNNMSLGQTKIKRKIKNFEGDGTMFAVKPDNYQKLWNFAAAAWAGIPAAPAKMMIDTYQGKMSATVQDDRISIGGNFIRRYEIEQVAKYRGWAVPQAA